MTREEAAAEIEAYITRGKHNTDAVIMAAREALAVLTAPQPLHPAIVEVLRAAERVHFRGWNACPQNTAAVLEWWRAGSPGIGPTAAEETAPAAPTVWSGLARGRALRAGGRTRRGTSH